MEAANLSSLVRNASRSFVYLLKETHSLTERYKASM